MDEEKWATVVGFEDYEVSTLGQVRNKITGTIRVGKFAGQGYVQHAFRKGGNGQKHYRYVHRMVWEAHVGPIPAGWQIDHVNCIRTDNSLSNLEAVTRQENMRRAKEHGLIASGERHGWALHPEKVIRGEDHYLRKDPSRVKRGTAKGRVSKVTEQDVLEMRRRHAEGEDRKSLGKAFGLHPGNVWCIVTRKTWTHI